MKLLDLSQLFVADCPYEKLKIKKIRFTPSQSTLKDGSENRPSMKGLKRMVMVLTLGAPERMYGKIT